MDNGSSSWSWLSACTIRRRLQQSGLSARRPLLGIPLTQNHRRLRRQWCDERRMWVAEWNEVVLTDESGFCLQHHDGRIRVWRHRGERMLNSCVLYHHTGPAPGIMSHHSRPSGIVVNDADCCAVGTGEYDFAAAKTTDHDVIGDATENNSANFQTLVVENQHINPPEEPELYGKC
ncbi:transposable element Tcb1 transposase [Trichonephila clavipes]|nr:transposable element Tcb1 transposase [Trichonephila clavipes]